MKRRLIASLCALALCLPLLMARVRGADYSGIYFLAVNEQFLYDLLTPSTMPVYSGGVAYVPALIFDANFTGVNLGLIPHYNASAGTFVIYNRQKRLLFDVNAQTCRDQNDSEYSARVIIRNGRVFVPVRFICTFFDLTFSTPRVDLPDGSVSVFRVCNDLVSLDDAIFASAATYLLPDQLARYFRDIAPPAPTATTPPVTANPQPSASTSPTTPSVVDMRHISVAIAVAVGAEGVPDAAVSALTAYSLPALFLFRPDDLAAQDDAVRMLLGLGHQIGLLLDGEAPQAQFDRGNDLLAHIARTRTRIVAFDGAAAEGDWLVWRGNVALSGPVTNALVAAIAAKRYTAYVTITDYSAATALRGLLQRLTDDRYTLRPATETILIS